MQNTERDAVDSQSLPENSPPSSELSSSTSPPISSSDASSTSQRVSPGVHETNSTSTFEQTSSSDGDPSYSNTAHGSIAGHEISISKVVEKYRPALVRMAARLLGEDVQARVDPSDVVQEALLSAASDSSPPRDEVGNIAIFPWLCRLVRQRLADAQRFHTRDRRSIHREHHPMVSDDASWIRPLVESLVDDTAGPGTKIARRERLHEMEAAIAALPEESRELIRLKYEDGLKTAEIAEALGISESAAKMRHLRIIETLRQALDDEGTSV